MNPSYKQNLQPKEGWVVIHLFYTINHAAWEELGEQQQNEALARLSNLVLSINSSENTQLLALSMLTPKADLGFMLLTPDLHAANRWEKDLGRSLGPEILEATFCFLSLTERSEYTTTEEDYADQIRGEHPENSPEFETAMQTFRDRMQKYAQDRLYPNMPDWPVFCFYPMSKKREAGQNWYALPFEERKTLMAGHAKIGRTFSGRVRQLITGSTGLDDAEWGVTLFAHDPVDIKEIVYQMRFDEVSARYADFGQFYIGLQLPLSEIFTRAGLWPTSG
ncbi:MAG: hydrogen peroxide-dependent heme synthase [Verrucomicrobiales bacterium]